jgi:SAM-dependent methyltransferase
VEFNVTKDNTVRLQYEDYPYPPRDPADEKKRLITGSPSQIAEFNHYVFAGRRDFSKPFRALVAGGGTGDAAIMLAQQLSDAGGGGTVTYLDLSRASADIAKARAQARGLANITFLQGSILDLDKLVTEPFDYIDCCGVLHHLEDPPAGLTSLANVLSDDGGMGLMVYAPYGRTGVYQMQSLLRMIGADDPAPTRLDQAKTLLRQLPPTNWLRRNDLVADHIKAGDAGLYDLLLHSRDRAYSVPEFSQLVTGADLRVVSFIEPIRYDPAAFIGDPALLETIEDLDWIERCAVAELLTGTLKTHVAYVVKAANSFQTIANPADRDLRPILAGLDPATASASLGANGRLTVTLDGLQRSIPISPSAAELLALMDGQRTMGEIEDVMVSDRSTMSREEFDRTIEEFFSVLTGLNLAFLRN